MFARVLRSVMAVSWRTQIWQSLGDWLRKRVRVSPDHYTFANIHTNEATNLKIFRGSDKTGNLSNDLYYSFYGQYISFGISILNNGQQIWYSVKTFFMNCKHINSIVFADI